MKIRIGCLLEKSGMHQKVRYRLEAESDGAWWTVGNMHTKEDLVFDCAVDAIRMADKLRRLWA